MILFLDSFKNCDALPVSLGELHKWKLNYSSDGIIGMESNEFL